MANHPNRGASVYEQHEAAFSSVSAYVIARDGERVATIAFKLPRDGAGRLYCYAHWFGYPMARGWAGGYGHDKRTAACSVASRKMRGQRYDRDFVSFCGVELEARPGPMFAELGSDVDKFMDALDLDGGRGWADYLRDAGFTVWQAV